MIDKKYLNKHDVSDYVGVSIGKVELMMKEGLRYTKFGRNVRFDVNDIDTTSISMENRAECAEKYIELFKNKVL